MENSLLLAQVLGPVFVVIWLSIGVNSKHYSKMSKTIQSSDLLIYILSIFSLAFGIFSFLLVKQMTNNSEIILAIISLIMIVKSIVFMIFPEAITTLVKKPKQLEKLIAIPVILYLIVWIYLTYTGYNIYM